MLIARRDYVAASVAIVALRARSGRSRKARAEHGQAKSLPDLLAILGRMRDALSVVVVAYRAIDERASDPEAAIVLAQGIAALNVVYNEIDIAEGQLYRATLASSRSS